jgi:hypothetical protein
MRMAGLWAVGWIGMVRFSEVLLREFGWAGNWEVFMKEASSRREKVAELDWGIDNGLVNQNVGLLYDNVAVCNMSLLQCDGPVLHHADVRHFRTSIFMKWSRHILFTNNSSALVWCEVG